MQNILDLNTIDFSGNEEITEIITQGNFLRIERIFSFGQTTPDGFWYDQSEHEFVLVLQGEAKILFEDKQEQLFKTGDYIHIPAHVKHRVTYTSSEPVCIWLAIFYNQ